jgi:hypothetical protein
MLGFKIQLHPPIRIGDTVRWMDSTQSYEVEDIRSGCARLSIRGVGHGHGWVPLDEVQRASVEYGI